MITSTATTATRSNGSQLDESPVEYSEKESRIVSVLKEATEDRVRFDRRTDGGLVVDLSSKLTTLRFDDSVDEVTRVSTDLRHIAGIFLDAANRIDGRKVPDLTLMQPVCVELAIEGWEDCSIVIYNHGHDSEGAILTARACLAAMTGDAVREAREHDLSQTDNDDVVFIDK